MKAEAVFEVKNWKEDIDMDISTSQKITKAHVEYLMKGDLEGYSAIQYIMFYSQYNLSDLHQSTAKYTGVIYFRGKLKGKSGAFAMEDSGVFKGGIVESKIQIIEGSGIEDLTGIKGSGSYSVNEKGFKFEIDYQLE